MRLANGMVWGGEDGAALEAAVKKAGDRFGILFSGTVGSGKTTAAKELARGVFGFRVVDCSKPEEVDWLLSWRDWLRDGSAVVLDEIGRDGIRNAFGNKSKPVANFIRDLHGAWKDGEWDGRLFCTTNSTFDELLEIYDESVLDRLREMCVPCCFSQSRRASAGEAPEAPDADPAAAERALGTYRWDDYASHGIDTESDEFMAALHGSRSSGFLMDALCLMRVNTGTLTGEQCETVRAVMYALAHPDRMRQYLMDAFVYAICAPRPELEAFARGMARYAAAIAENNATVRVEYKTASAATMNDWFRRYDVARLVGRWRRNHKNSGGTLDSAVVAEFNRIRREAAAVAEGGAA